MAREHGDGAVVEDTLSGGGHGIMEYLEAEAVGARGLHADEALIRGEPHGLPVGRNQSVDEIFAHFIDRIGFFAVCVIDTYC